MSIPIRGDMVEFLIRIMETPDYRRLNDLMSRYGVQIRSARNNSVLVVFTELPENKGTSIANIIEHLATELYKTYFEGIPIGDIVWILHHLPEQMDSKQTEEVYHQVILQWDGHHLRSPRWIPIPKESWGFFGLTEI